MNSLRLCPNCSASLCLGCTQEPLYLEEEPGIVQTIERLIGFGLVEVDPRRSRLLATERYLMGADVPFKVIVHKLILEGVVEVPRAVVRYE